MLCQHAAFNILNLSKYLTWQPLLRYMLQIYDQSLNHWKASRKICQHTPIFWNLWNVIWTVQLNATFIVHYMHTGTICSLIRKYQAWIHRANKSHYLGIWLNECCISSHIYNTFHCFSHSWWASLSQSASVTTI